MFANSINSEVEAGSPTAALANRTSPNTVWRRNWEHNERVANPIDNAKYDRCLARTPSQIMRRLASLLASVASTTVATTEHDPGPNGDEEPQAETRSVTHCHQRHYVGHGRLTSCGHERASEHLRIRRCTNMSDLTVGRLIPSNRSPSKRDHATPFPRARLTRDDDERTLILPLRRVASVMPNFIMREAGSPGLWIHYDKSPIARASSTARSSGIARPLARRLPA